MIFNEKKYFEIKVSKLYEQNYISKDQLEKISLDYGFNSKVVDNFILKILAFVFAALALLLIISYNWENIPKLARLLLLLILLGGTHFLIYYFKDKNFGYAQCFGILANFVLLANFGLLSQMYHLENNLSMGFLTIGWASLLMAWALKSFYVFVQAYIFASLGFILGLSILLDSLFYIVGIEFNVSSFHTTFIIFIILGFLTQKSFRSKTLVFLNFVFLGVYCFNAPFFIFFLEMKKGFEYFSEEIYFWYFLSYLLWYALLMSAFRPYKKLAFFVMSCTFLCFYLFLGILGGNCYGSGLKELYKNECFIFSFHLPYLGLNFWIYSLPLVLFIVLHTIKKHYFLAFFALVPIYLNFIQSGVLLSEWGYSFLSLLFGIYLVYSGYKFLGIFSIFVLAIIQYIHVVGDYIGASVLFLVFGLILFVFSLFKKRRRDA